MSFTHNLDQMSAMLRDLSPVLFGYYEALKGAGFTEVQAFMLVLDYQKSLWNKK